MSMINSIANCRKIIGRGVSREAFYSRKYNVVFKMDRLDYGHYNGTTRQTRNEMRLFRAMEDWEREIFPIIDVMQYKNRVVIVMKKCTSLYNYHPDAWDILDAATTNFYGENVFRDVSVKLGLDESYITHFNDFIIKYGINDIHIHNIGVCDNHLVVIDAGC